MDRRRSIKALIIGSVSAGTILEACKLQDKKDEKKAGDGAGGAEGGTEGANGATPGNGIDRMKEEAANDAAVRSKTFFTPDEMAALTILCDIIIPRDEVSGSASDAKVPEFIGVIVIDMPQHQTPMRGGLRWMDMQCLTRFEKPFKDCDHGQQMEIVDEIAWPEKVKPGMEQGVSFFNLLRNLTASGFYTSQMGFKDIGYVGNVPNQWNGVPADVLKKHGLAYSEKELKECVSFSA